MGALLIRNVRPAGAAAVDVLVQGDRIAAVGAALQPPPGCAVEEGAGALLLPGLVEGHTHLDKTLWGMDWYRNEVGARLSDKIDNERNYRHESGHDAAAQSLALAQAFLVCGTTRLRTHVDVDTQAGLRHLEGVVRTRDAMAVAGSSRAVTQHSWLAARATTSATGVTTMELPK